MSGLVASTSEATSISCVYNTFFEHEMMFFICLVRSSKFAIKTVTGQTFYYMDNQHIAHLLAVKHFRYGGERYEKKELQMRVRSRFAELQRLDEKDGRVPWHVVGKLAHVARSSVDQKILCDVVCCSFFVGK